MHEKLSDGQLIERYVKSGDQQAIKALIDRYYDGLYRRLSRKLRNTADAEDCCQETWRKVINSLDTYRDEGKFANYLAVVASNVLKDHWGLPGQPEKTIADDFPLDSIDGDWPGPDRHLDGAAEVKYVIETAIPSLPVDQRMAWLLFHESIFWESSLPLGWSTLAMLNGVDTDTVWNKFESARNTLLKAGNFEKPGKAEKTGSSLDEEELLIFLVWTQANRAGKTKKYTWNYYAELLDVPPSTLKTRYAAAKKHIESAMESYRGLGNV